MKEEAFNSGWVLFIFQQDVVNTLGRGFWWAASVGVSLRGMSLVAEARPQDWSEL